MSGGWLRYPIHDGMIGVATRDGKWAQIFPHNIIWFQARQESSSGRLDMRDLAEFDAIYLILYDDDLNPFKAYRLKEISLSNPRLGKWLRGG